MFSIVTEHLQVQVGKDVRLSREMLLKEDLGLSSMKLVMFLTNLTAQLGIDILSFADYELLRLKTVGNVVDLLTEKSLNENGTN